MLEQLMNLLRGVVEKDEFFELNAIAMRKAYDALRNQNFTPEETLRLLEAHGIGFKVS